MWPKRLFHKPAPEPVKDCRNCQNLHCPASLLNLTEFPIEVLERDLYDPHVNLIDKLICPPELCRNQWSEKTPETPAKRRRRWRFGANRELKAVRGELDRISADLAAFVKRMEAADGLRSRMGEFLAEVRAELEAVGRAAGRTTLPEADRRLLEQALERLRELRERALEQAGLEALAERVEALAGRVERRPPELERLAADLERLASRSVEKRELEALAGRMDTLADQAARRGELEVATSRIDRIAAEAAPAKKLAELEARLEGLPAWRDQGREIGQLETELAQLAARSASASELAELAEVVGRLKQQTARAGELDLLGRRLEELARKSSDRDALELLAEKVARISERYADRDLYYAALARIEDVFAKAARQPVVDELGRRVEEVETTRPTRSELERARQDLAALERVAARQDDLAALAASLSRLEARAADQTALAAVEARVRDLISSLNQLSDRAAEKSALADAAGRLNELGRVAATKPELDALRAALARLETGSATVGALAALAARLDDLAQKAAEKNELETLAESIAEVKKTAAGLEPVKAAFARLEKLLGQTADRAAVAGIKDELATLAERIDAQDELVDSMARLDDRVAGFGKRLDQTEVSARLEAAATSVVGAEARSTPPSADRDLAARVSGPELGGVDLRIGKLESDHAELKRQIRKAFENLTEYRLRDLDELKAKAAKLEATLLELTRKAETPPASPKPGAGPAAHRAAAKDAGLAPLPALSRLWALRSPQRLIKLLTHRNLIVIGLTAILALLGGVALAWRLSNGHDDGRPAPLAGGTFETAEAAADRDEGEDGLAPAPNAIYDEIAPALAPPMMDIGSERLDLKDGKIDLTGYAPGATRAQLYLNGAEAAWSEVVNQGFAFYDVPLEWGRNVLEVKVTDDRGGEASSMASVLERLSDAAAHASLQKSLNRMRGPRQHPYLALTFDAGANSHRADQVLQILADKGVVTTFFLTGQFIDQNPELVQRIVAAGHEVGVHTYRHPHLTTYETNGRNLTHPGMSRERLQEELLATRRRFEDLTGAKMSPWWRAPYGEYNRSILEWAEEAGFQHVDWTRTPKNLDMLDWVADPTDRHYFNREALRDHLVNLDDGVPGAAAGGIVLVHLGSDRKTDFLDQILGDAIDQLRAKGYQFVTVSHLFMGK